MREPLQDLQWHLKMIRAEEAWALSKGAGVTIGIIDTGTAAHPDLYGQCVAGWDFVDNTANTSDRGALVPTYHGIGCAGIAAALDDGIGTSGVAPHAKISHIRVMSGSGHLSTSLAKPILWGAGERVKGLPMNPNPSRVLSLSLSWWGNVSEVEQNAIDRATELGCIVVVAAGNDDHDAAGNAPANARNVIAVGAINRDRTRTAYSNYGNTVTISSPVGVSDALVNQDSDGNGRRDTILGASKWGGHMSYGMFWGTSAAAPTVAGVVALMLSANPSLKFEQVKNILQETATPFSRPMPEEMGAGIVNAEAAVKAAIAKRRNI